MRTCVLFSLFLFVFCSASISYAKFDLLKKLKDKVEKKVEDTVDIHFQTVQHAIEQYTI